MKLPNISICHNSNSLQNDLGVCPTPQASANNVNYYVASIFISLDYVVTTIVERGDICSCHGNLFLKYTCIEEWHLNSSGNYKAQCVCLNISLKKTTIGGMHVD